MITILISLCLPAGNDAGRLLDAMERVESGGRDVIGDDGRSRGPLQIQRDYWRDSGVPGRYEQVSDRAYARRVVMRWWDRYCPGAVVRGDWERLARCHNGGPNGHRKAATARYWQRVRREMR